MKTHKKISVIGCGWLGLPLAKKFISEGFQVYGSTTAEEKLKTLADAGIKPFLLYAENTNPAKDNSLFNSEYIIINIPPGRNKDVSGYSKKIENIVRAVEEENRSSKLIFTSSTSVYGNLEGTVNEESTPKPSTDSGNAVLKAEKIIQNSQLNSTILRLSGLVGGDRHPVKYLAGRNNLNNPDHPVNLIHLEDCIKIISEVIKNEIWGEVFNCSSPDHPTRKEYYTEAARSRGLEMPEFLNESAGNGKIINSQKLTAALNYKFIYPSPFDFK